MGADRISKDQRIPYPLGQKSQPPPSYLSIYRFTTYVDVANDSYPATLSLPIHDTLTFGGFQTTSRNGIPIDLIIA